MKIAPLPSPPGPAAAEPIRVGVSACLLGQRVRWDGGHKSDAFLIETLGRFVEWVAVCPEVEVGLPVPRDTLRLVRRVAFHSAHKLLLMAHSPSPKELMLRNHA